MEYEDFNDVVQEYAKIFRAKTPYSREDSGTKDDYKKKMREINFEFYSLPMTKANSTLKHYKQHAFWTVSEFLSEIFAMNPPLMYKYKPEIIEWSYKLRPDKSVEYMYGRRWQEYNELLNVVEVLSKRTDSKRAIIPIFTPYDTEVSRTDVPCTLMYDVKIRENKINMTTFFRSHDFFAGFKYDVLLSSFVGQSLAMMINANTKEEIEPGTLNFYEGSLHVYEKDKDKIDKLFQPTPVSSPEFNIMHDYNSIEEYFDDLWNVVRAEESSYFGNFKYSRDKIKDIKNPAFRDFAKLYYNRNAKFNKLSTKIQYETEVLTW